MADTSEITKNPRPDEQHRVPAVDIYETDENVVLMADMPGVGEDGVEVSVEEGALTIVGRPAAGKGETGKTIYSEYDPVGYRRVFTLSPDLRGDNIQGKIQNGVLRLTLPKAEEAKVKKITIKVE